MINKLKVLMSKVDIIEEKKANVSREMEILRKNWREVLEIKNTVTEIKNVFDGFIKRLYTAQEIISELEDIATETPKTKEHKENRLEKTRTEYLRSMRQLQKV